MQTIPRTSGIYKWTCTPTGRIYIGSAVNLQARWYGHRATLRGGRHSNAYLQHAWNKYGEDAFTFEVLELVLAPFLLEREQYYLDKLKPFTRNNGFNIYPTAGSPYGYEVSDEARQKMSVSQKKRAAEMSVEEKANFYKNRKKPAFANRRSPSPETREKIRQGVKARWAQKGAGIGGAEHNSDPH
jgi:group I intron endonuclease